MSNKLLYCKSTNRHYVNELSTVGLIKIRAVADKKLETIVGRLNGFNYKKTKPKTIRHTASKVTRYFDMSLIETKVSV